MVPSGVISRHKSLAATRLHQSKVVLGKPVNRFGFTTKHRFTVFNKSRSSVGIKLLVRTTKLNKAKSLAATKLLLKGKVIARSTKVIDAIKLIAKLAVVRSGTVGTSTITQTPIKRFLLDGVEDMAIDIPHVVKTINKRIVAEPNGNSGVLVYTPGKWTKAASAGTTVGIEFWGLIWTLQLTCRVASLMEVELDPPDPAASQADLALQAKALGENPNITLRMYVSNPNDLQNDSDLLWVSIYNSRPVYQVDLMPYLTRSNLFGLEYGKQLKIDIIDNGYGVLRNDDNISVTGNVFEESNYFIGVSGTVEPIISQ